MTAEEHWKVALLVAIMQLLKCSPVENWDGTLIERDAGIIPLALENKEEKCHYQIRSDQISRSVVSDSLRPHESQHARPESISHLLTPVRGQGKIGPQVGSCVIASWIPGPFPAQRYFRLDLRISDKPERGRSVSCSVVVVVYWLSRVCPRDSPGKNTGLGCRFLN